MSNPLLEKKTVEVVRIGLRQRDAAKALGISVRTLFTLTKSGEIPSAKLGNAVIYDVDDLRGWLTSRKTTAASAPETGTR